MIYQFASFFFRNRDIKQKLFLSVLDISQDFVIDLGKVYRPRSKKSIDITFEKSNITLKQQFDKFSILDQTKIPV